MNTFHQNGARIDDDLNDLFTRSISQYSTNNKTANVNQTADHSPGEIISAIADISNTLPHAPPPVAVEQINLPAAAVKEETKDSAEKLERTVFIGNVPAQIAVNKSKLREFKRLLSGFGKLESIRFRSAAFQRPLKDTKTRKYAFNHGELHPERDSINAYAVYMDKSAVVKAISKLNGKEFEGHHLRVDSCCAAANESKHDTKRSVFIGNLPFTLNEEQLWQLFGQCGQVDKVRLIRDRLTGIGKGFAYVQFRERSSVPLALELDGSMKCAGRLLRIQKCSAAGGPSNAKSSFEGAKSARLTGARLRLQRKTKTTPSATSTDNNVSPDKSRKRNRHDKQ